MNGSLIKLGWIALAIVGFIAHRLFRTGDGGLKQTMFMTLMTLLGVAGTILHPFWGVLLYYTFAVLRPQHLWAWALPHNIRWSLMAAGAAFIGVVLSLPRVMVRSNWNTIATLSVIFAVTVLLSCLTAFNPSVSTSSAIEYAKIFVMAGLATLVIDRLEYVRYTAVMIFICIAYISYEINTNYLLDGQLNIFHKGYGGLDNNGAGLLMAMGIPFAYGFARAAQSWMVKLGCALAGALMLHAVMMSYSRGAMLAAVVCIVWLLIHHRPRFEAGLLAIATFVVVLILAGAEIRQRFLSIERYTNDASAQSRLDSWSAAWEITWDYPFLGVGPRNSNIFSQIYGADIPGRTIHSQYLQIAADSGVFAAAVYLLIAVTALRSMGRMRRQIEELHDDYHVNLERALAPPKLKLGTTPEERAAQPPKRAKLPRRPRVDFQYAMIALSIQTSLITFFFGGIFLSMEIVELPWLLLMLAGVMPGLVERRLHPKASVHMSFDPDSLEPLRSPWIPFGRLRRPT